MIYEKQVDGSIIALSKEGEYYLCDSQFNEIYSIHFQELKHKFSKFYIGKRNNKWALLDCLGNMYSDFLYEEIVWFESDLFLCFNAKEWVIINSKNNNVLGETFKTLLSLKNGIATLQNQNEYVFVNGYLDILNRVKYINEDVEFNGAGFAVVQFEDGRKGLLKMNGEWFAEPAILQTN
jgi:hypothetical protein